ncbi:MAG TPA: GNAT family N-acetyltransferase [Rhodopila sp.]|jgi:ribosomal-protein-alanine N-acetyltransferase|nr:GNAT family N-acetyltransferase [Rhodopila sp.]
MTPALPRATLADLDVMEAIHASAFPAAERWSRDVFSLQLGLPNVLGLLHRSGGLILLRIAADEAEILTLAVTPDVRRRGIGATLLREALAHAVTLGVGTLFLEVSVANQPARLLYAGVGFVQAGRRPHYYADRSDALVLRLDLPTAPAATPDCLTPRDGSANG